MRRRATYLLPVDCAGIDEKSAKEAEMFTEKEKDGFL